MEKNFCLPENINVWDAENIFYLKSHPSRMAKLLAHYELYKKIVGIPGAVVECGVYKGASLVRFASFRDVLENNNSRTIYGLDAFGSFPSSGIESQADRAFIDKFEAEGGEGISKDSLGKALSAKGFSNFELVKGDVFSTIPELLDRLPHLRIALLHLDMDVYEPTKFAIERFLPHMTPGGIIMFDDYNSVEGATRVADELCRAKGLRPEKLTYYNVPAFVSV